MSNGGDGFTNLPPTDVTVSDVTEQDVNYRLQATQQALGQKDAGVHPNFWANFWASIFDGTGNLINDFVDGLDTVLAFVGKFFLVGQGEKNASFYDLSAAILEDLTGVEVDKEKLKASAFGSGRLAAMETFGADLYNLLAKEFSPASGNLEDGDDAPAQRFLGFLMNFAIRQGNIELLTSLLPEEWRVGDGFRAYGELMAKNLGLGRMARRALQPLIQILVADPLMNKLQAEYRPKRVGAGEAIKDYFRGAMELAELQKELGQEGYSDTRQTRLIDAARPLVGERELIRIMFRRGLGQADLAADLSKRGFTDNAQTSMIEAERPFIEKNEVALLYANQLIDKSTAVDLLKKIGFDDTVQIGSAGSLPEVILEAHNIQHQRARRLGLGELKKAFHNNVIDLLELKAHLSQQGFSDDDIQIITLDLLQPTTGKVRQLSLAEIKAGFKAGVLTETQAAEHLKALGYSDADVAVILKTLPAPKTPTTPTTPPSTPPSPPAVG